MVDKLTPTDSRVEHHTFTIPNTTRKYHYLLGNPSSTPVATVLLVHGFPDLVSHLTSSGTLPIKTGCLQLTP